MKTLMILLSVSAVAFPALAQVDAKSQINKAEPAGARSKAKTAEPCCSVTAVNSATGVVTLKDLKTGKSFNVTVQNKARLGALRVGQNVDKNL